MAIATDQQVQNFFDTRVRPRCEQIRALLTAIEDDISAIGPTYNACTEQSPTWSDNRTDGPPTLATAAMLADWNTVIVNLQALLTGGSVNASATAAQMPVVLGLCVRSVLGG